MSSNIILMMDNRQLIPRWHTSRKLYKLNQAPKNELRGISGLDEDYWFKQSVGAWKVNPTKTNTIDVFVRLIQADERDHPLFNVIHRNLLDWFKELPKVVRGLVCPELKCSDNVSLYSTGIEEVRAIIRKLKSIVIANPRDSLTWIDLSFYYSIANDLKKAKYCAEVAKNLDPNNVFIARSYSRFLVHIGEPDKAVWFLNRRSNFKVSPLLQSALISISSTFEIGHPNIKEATSLMMNWKGEGYKVSELLASIGTIEIHNGALRKGKKYVERALSESTENVVAHAAWLHHKHGLRFNNMSSVMNSIEGGVNELYVKKQFKKCREKLLEMHEFQPYSTGPIVDAGYLSIVALDDPQFVIDISKNRISKSHMGFGELNNLIVAKLMKKETVDIDVDLRLLSRRVQADDPSSCATFKATMGMALLENQMIAEGKEMYDGALEILKKHKLNRGLCLASHFYSKQIEGISPEKSARLKRESISLAKKYGVLELYI